MTIKVTIKPWFSGSEEFDVAYLRELFLAALAQYKHRKVDESDGFTMGELCL